MQCNVCVCVDFVKHVFSPYIAYIRYLDLSCVRVSLTLAEKCTSDPQEGLSDAFIRLATCFLFPLTIIGCRPQFGGQTPKKNPQLSIFFLVAHCSGFIRCGLFQMPQASSSLHPTKNSHQDSEGLNRQWHRCQGFFSPEKGLLMSFAYHSEILERAQPLKL